MPSRGCCPASHVVGCIRESPLLVSPFPGGGVHLYWSAGAPIYRLLLRVGIKVADEGLISWGYVRSSNIYVRGYLD